MNNDMPEEIYAINQDGFKRWFDSWLPKFGEEIPDKTTRYVRYDILKTDLDLPIKFRTQANLWKVKFLELHNELQSANKGLRRLNRKIKKLKNKLDKGID